MSTALGLIKCLVENNIPLSTLFDYGINETYFDTDKERKAYNFIKYFRETYGKYPELSTIARECNISILNKLPIEPLEYWIYKTKERKQTKIITKLVNQIEKLLPQGETQKALELINQTYLDLKNIDSPYKIKDIHELAESALQDSIEIQVSGEKIPGIPFGLPTLDELTGGMHGGDLIFLVGETGVNKSYISLYCALHAYLSNKNIMMISPEMVEKQIGRRAIALNAGISDRFLKKGELSYYGMLKIRNLIQQMKSRENWFKILPSGMFTDISDIISACTEYKPDLLVVDGIYLLKNSALRTNSPWKEDESIIFKLRELGLKQNIPVFCTTQYSRRGKNKREGARGTQSVEQTSTLFLSLEFEFEEDKEIAKPVTTRLLKIKKGRDGERMVIRLRIDFNKTKIEEEDVLSAPDYIINSKDEPIMEDL